MSKSSCIPHSANISLVIIREDYLTLCEGDHCAAAILNAFEFWTNGKLINRPQAEIENAISEQEGLPADQDTSVWIYKTQVQLHGDLLGLFGERKISEALKTLKNKGFLDTRTNPKFKWDKTLQYRLEVEEVTIALQNCGYGERKIATSKPQKRGINTPQNAEALPLNSTLTPTENNTSPNGETPQPPVKKKRVNPAEPWHDALVAVFGIDPATLTRTADGNYWKVATELYQSHFPVERVHELHAWVKRKAVSAKWTGNFSVNSLSKYAPDFLAAEAAKPAAVSPPPVEGEYPPDEYPPIDYGISERYFGKKTKERETPKLAKLDEELPGFDE